MTWLAIGIGAAGCYLLKLAGLSVPHRALDQPTVSRVADLVPVALLAALIAVQVLAGDGGLTLDARVVGVGVAAAALALRAPFLLVVVLAAASAALVRLL